jgi:hypothetical protein
VFGCFCAETPVAQEQKPSAGSALGVVHLDAREVRVQNCYRRIEDLLKQDLRPAGVDQLRSNLL